MIITRSITITISYNHTKKKVWTWLSDCVYTYWSKI